MLRCLIILGIISILMACNEQTVRKHKYEVHGIDVSHYQRAIDWEKVAAQDIHFGFIKATEGESFKDSFYCENWAAMKAAGVKRGAYHFFRPSLSANLQAANYIETTEFEHGDFVPVLDIELLDNIPPQEMRSSVKEWLQIVEDHYRVKPILYTYQKFYNKHLSGHFHDYPIWIARYSSWRKPNLYGNQEWAFWQYGNRGNLNGIDGPVDFNVFAGSESELNTHCFVRPEPLFDPPPEPAIDIASANP